MYYEKKYVTHPLYKGRVYVNDFSSGIRSDKHPTLTPIYTANSSFNTRFESGALKSSNGIKRSDFNGSSAVFNIPNCYAKKLYYYKRYDEKVGLYVDYLMVYATDKNVYQLKIGQDDQFSVVQELNFENPPECASYTYNGKDVVIFSEGNSLKVYDGESVTSVTDGPKLTSICIHNERLFATEGGQKTTLWFSDDFNPLNWNLSLEEAGYIDLRDGRGSLVKVISFNGYVYVFRNYGITRITAYGDQTAFSVDGITASIGKISPKSIAVCGNQVIFLAKEGFYTFSGGSPVRIMERLDGVICGVEQDEAKGVYYNGNYYCLLKVKDENENYISGVVCYNLADKTFTLYRDLYIEDFTLLEGENYFKLLFICADNCAIGELSNKSEYFGGSLQKSWKSGKSDFDVRKIKNITRLFINTKTPIELTLESERGSRKVYFKGSPVRQSLPVSIAGEYFSVQIKCEYPECLVTYIGIEFEYGV